MNVLVTGGAGFIGQWTVRALVEAGHRVRVLDSLEPPVHPTKARPAWLSKLGVDFVKGSVTEANRVVWALQDMEAVIHLAAYQDYQPDWSRYMNVNVGGLALLLETIAARGMKLSRIVIASSQAVYGEGEGRLPLTETSELRPSGIYGVSKAAAEMVANRLYALYGMPVVILRYSITQGAGQSPHNHYSGILRNSVQLLRVGQPPRIYDDGEQRRDYVWAGDVARANLMALTDPHMVGETYNVGRADVLTALAYGRIVAKRMGLDIEPVITGEHRPGDARHAVSDCSKLIALGWNPTKGIPEIIDEYVAWLGQPERVTA